MLKFLAAFHLDDPASLKRALTTALGGVVILTLNPILTARGIPPVSDTALELFAGLLAGFVLQSGAKSAVVAKAEVVAAASLPPAMVGPVSSPTAPSQVLGQ